MKRKLIFDRGELVISNENKEIVHLKNLGTVEIEGFEVAFNLGAVVLFNKLKEIGNEYLFDKYGIKRFLG